MAGLYTAREVATGALTPRLARWRWCSRGIAAFDINLDPRLVALTTAKATADHVLSDYNATLATAQAAIKLFPIEADPALLALTTMRDNVALGLVAAKEALAAGADHAAVDYALCGQCHHRRAVDSLGQLWRQPGWHAR